MNLPLKEAAVGSVHRDLDSSLFHEGHEGAPNAHLECHGDREMAAGREDVGPQKLQPQQLLQPPATDGDWSNRTAFSKPLSTTMATGQPASRGKDDKDVDDGHTLALTNYTASAIPLIQ